LVGGGVLLVVMAWMTISIMRQADTTVTQRVRAGLRERLAGLRLARMLAKRGIAAETYIEQTVPDTAKAQLSACEACAAVVRCESALESDLPLKDLSFCANAAALEALTHHSETTAANDEPASATRRVAGCGQAG
jgi:hypothetical protein